MSDEQKPAVPTKPEPTPGLVVNNGPSLVTLIVALSASSVVSMGLLFAGMQYLRSEPAPSVPSTPVTIEQPAKPVIFTTTDTDVLQDGRKLSDEKARPVIDVANLGDGEYVVRFSPVGEDEVYRKVIVSGGTAPRPPPTDPVKPLPDTTPVVDPTTKPTAATYVYEKDDTAIPSGVMAGLNRLNREKKILATVYEDDTTNGKDSVPEQYKAPADAARKEGLPALVFTSGNVVLKVVKAPKTEQEVFEAAN